jgi:hypothetical protein
MGQNCYEEVGNKSFENVAKLKYFKTTLTHKISIREEIQRILATMHISTFCVPIC